MLVKWVKRGFVFILIVIIMSGCKAETEVGVVKSQEPKPTKEATKEPNTTAPDITVAPVKRIHVKGEPLNKNKSVIGIDKFIQESKKELLYLMFYNEKQLLFVRGQEEDLSAGLFDLETDSLIKEVSLEALGMITKPVILETGQIFLSNGMEFYIYDKNLDEVMSSDEIGIAFDQVVPLYNGTGVFYLLADQPIIYQYDFKTKKSNEKMNCSDVEGGIFLKSASNDGKFLYGMSLDETYEYVNNVINLETKKIHRSSGPAEQIYPMNHSFVICKESKGKYRTIQYYDPNFPRSYQSFVLEDMGEEDGFYAGEQYVLAMKNCQKDESNAILSLYDKKTGKLCYETELDRACYEAYTGLQKDEEVFLTTQEGVSFSPDGKMITILFHGSDQVRAVVWDFEQDKKGEETEFVYLQKEPTTKVEQLHKKLEQQYGITILIKDEVFGYFPDFAVTPEYDENLIYKALQELETVLKKFPDNFYKELMYDDIKQFQIYLCGKLIQGSEYGIENPAGFSLVFEGKQMIVLDINQIWCIQTNFAHETMHAIDAKLNYNIAKKKLSDKLLDKWDHLNPKDHGYRYGYVDENGEEYSYLNNMQYTPYDERSKENVNNIYYIDYYANTFPTEDRARIFETLVMANGELPDYFESKNIQKKAKLLCQIIRETMDCLDDVEETEWEKELK